MFKFNGMEIEGNVEIVPSENGGFILKEIEEGNTVPEETSEEPKDLMEAIELKPDSEDEDEEEIELIQCNFLAERWLLDYFEMSYREAKSYSTTKILKRELVGRLIMEKFKDDYVDVITDSPCPLI